MLSDSKVLSSILFLFEFNLKLSLTTQPLVRSITCWTLGRYASWIAQVTSEEHRVTYFVPTVEGVS